MLLPQTIALVSPEQKSGVLALLRDLAQHQPGEDQRAYAHAEALFTASYLSGPPPPPAERHTQLLAAVVLKRAAATFERAEHPAKALLCMALACKLDPQEELLIRMLGLLQGLRLHEDALEALSALLRVDGQRARRRDWWQMLARTLEESLSRHSDAADAYGNAANEFPEHPEFLAGQARCLEAARRYDELLSVIYRQIASEKSDSRLALLHTRLGNLLETVLGNEARAMEHYRTAVRLAPGFEPPIQGLLALAEQRGDWGTVAEVLKIRLRTEARPKERATVLTRLGEVVAQRLKDPLKALGYLERAIREYPRGLPARLLLLELLCEQREFARAERFATPPDVSEAQGLNPAQLARLCQIRARVAAERDRPLEALECLSLALEVAPRPRAILEDLITLLRQHEPETPPPEILARKARDWQRGHENELAAMALLAEGLLRQYQGRVEAAEESLLAARDLAPQHPSFAEALGDLYYHLRRMNDAAGAFLAAARPGHPSEARLTVRAAQVLSDHLGQHDRALEILRELHARGAASSESCLYMASLALSQSHVDEARLALELAGGWVPADHQHVLQGLRVELARAMGDDPQALATFRIEGARAGDERSLRALAEEYIAQGKEQVLEQILAAIPKERLPVALRIMGDACRRAGRAPRAMSYYRRALDTAGGHNLEAIEGMSLLSPTEALNRLESLLTTDPFNPHGLSLLSTLLSSTGEATRAQGLYQLSTFQDGPGALPAPNFERFWEELRVIDPFLSLIVLLHRSLPGAFEPREAAIASQSQEVKLPATVEQALSQVCEKGGLKVPQILLHPNVGGDPLALRSPPAVVISPLLLRPEMPEGAVLFMILRGLAHLGLEVGPLTYLAPYQLDVMAEALRTVASPDGGSSGATPSASLLTGAIEISYEQSELILREAALYPGAQSADPLQARVALDRAVLRAALGATRGLVAALSSISLLPPPSGIAFQATKRRWLRQLARLPLARAAMGYTLSDHFAKLRFQP